MVSEPLANRSASRKAPRSAQVTAWRSSDLKISLAVVAFTVRTISSGTTPNRLDKGASGASPHPLRIFEVFDVGRQAFVMGRRQQARFGAVVIEHRYRAIFSGC